VFFCVYLFWYTILPKSTSENRDRFLRKVEEIYSIGITEILGQWITVTWRYGDRFNVWVGNNISATIFFPWHYNIPPPQVGWGLLNVDASLLHLDTPNSTVLLWTSYQYVAETSNWKHNNHKGLSRPGRFRTPSPWNRAAADPRSDHESTGSHSLHGPNITYFRSTWNYKAF